MLSLIHNLSRSLSFSIGYCISGNTNSSRSSSQHICYPPQHSSHLLLSLFRKVGLVRSAPVPDDWWNPSEVRSGWTSFVSCSPGGVWKGSVAGGFEIRVHGYCWPAEEERSMCPPSHTIRWVYFRKMLLLSKSCSCWFSFFFVFAWKLSPEFWNMGIVESLDL